MKSVDMQQFPKPAPRVGWLGMRPTKSRCAREMQVTPMKRIAYVLSCRFSWYLAVIRTVIRTRVGNYFEQTLPAVVFRILTWYIENDPDSSLISDGADRPVGTTAPKDGGYLGGD